MAVQTREQVEVLQNMIGGQWQPSNATETMDVHNPATDELLVRVPMGTAADVDAAVQAASKAFPGWRSTPPQERAKYFFALRELLLKNREELARLITTEMGKTLDDARGEVTRGIENVETACGMPTLMMGYGLEDGAAKGIDEEVIYQPLGVFAAICPFNFPFMIPFWFWPYAVGAGNTYIVKPSEQVPMTQRRVFELIHEAGFPPGVMNLVNGSRDVVNALLDHPDIRGISFVGATKTAAYVYERAAKSGKRVQAQGGAKNTLIVLPDADLDAFMPTIINSCFGAAGQRCLANSLVMSVGDSAKDMVLRDFVGAASLLKVGDGSLPGVDMGPVVSATARDRIVGAIGRGVEDGAQAVLDGRNVKVADRAEGYFVGPTVLDSVSPQNRVFREEIFGPVIGHTSVSSLDEAIALINSGDYGNAASIFTESGAAARKFRYEVQTGNVGINVGVAAPMSYFPFSGARRSFFGVLHGQGRDAVRFFTESKVVVTRWGGGDLSGPVTGIGR